MTFFKKSCSRISGRRIFSSLILPGSLKCPSPPHRHPRWHSGYSPPCWRPRSGRAGRPAPAAPGRVCFPSDIPLRRRWYRPPVSAHCRHTGEGPRRPARAHHPGAQLLLRRGRGAAPLSISVLASQTGVPTISTSGSASTRVTSRVLSCLRSQRPAHSPPGRRPRLRPAFRGPPAHQHIRRRAHLVGGAQVGHHGPGSGGQDHGVAAAGTDDPAVAGVFSSTRTPSSCSSWEYQRTRAWSSSLKSGILPGMRFPPVARRLPGG